MAKKNKSKKTSMKGGASSHLRPCKVAYCDKHNERLDENPSNKNIRPEFMENNRLWKALDVPNLVTLDRQIRKDYYIAHGRHLPERGSSKASPLKESVTLMPNGSIETDEIQRRIVNRIEKEFGIRCIRRYNHRDEFCNETGEFNWHGHEVWDMYDHKNHCMIKLSRADCRKWQDIVAEETGMPRGIPAYETRRKWLDANYYKIMKQEEDLQQKREEMNKLDERLRQQKEEEQARGEHLRQLDADRQAMDERLSQKEEEERARNERLRQLEAEEEALVERILRQKEDERASNERINQQKAQEQALGDNIIQLKAEEQARNERIRQQKAQEQVLGENVIRLKAEERARTELLQQQKAEELALDERICEKSEDIQALTERISKQKEEEQARGERIGQQQIIEKSLDARIQDKELEMKQRYPSSVIMFRAVLDALKDANVKGYKKMDCLALICDHLDYDEKRVISRLLIDNGIRYSLRTSAELEKSRALASAGNDKGKGWHKKQK